MERVPVRVQFGGHGNLQATGTGNGCTENRDLGLELRVVTMEQNDLQRTSGGGVSWVQIPGDSGSRSGSPLSLQDGSSDLIRPV